jgi:hypothetical protein
MNTELQENTLNNPAAQPASVSVDRRALRGGRSGGAWIGGVVLIALGAMILLQDQVGLALGRWWALLLLVPAAGAFASAWRGYQNAGGQLTASVRGCW